MDNNKLILVPSSYQNGKLGYDKPPATCGPLLPACRHAGGTEFIKTWCGCGVWAGWYGYHKRHSAGGSAQEVCC